MQKKRTGKLRHKLKWVWFRCIVVLQVEYHIISDENLSKGYVWEDVSANEYLDILSERGVIAQLGVI